MTELLDPDQPCHQGEEDQGTSSRMARVRRPSRTEGLNASAGGGRWALAAGAFDGAAVPGAGSGTSSGTWGRSTTWAGATQPHRLPWATTRWARPFGHLHLRGLLGDLGRGHLALQRGQADLALADQGVADHHREQAPDHEGARHHHGRSAARRRVACLRRGRLEDPQRRPSCGRGGLGTGGGPAGGGGGGRGHQATSPSGRAVAGRSRAGVR